MKKTRVSKVRVKRVVLAEDYHYFFYRGSKCVRIENKKERFRNINFLEGQKIRLIAEILIPRRARKP